MIGGAKLTIKDLNEMRSLRADGLSLRDLATRFDMSLSGTYRHVKDIPPPSQGWVSRGRPRKFNHALAARLSRQGYTYAVLAERFGVAEMSVWNAVNGRPSRSYALEAAQ